MAIKVIIQRKVPKGKQEALVPLLMELRARAIKQAGYISGETLRNVADPEDYIVISVWQSVDAWKEWAAQPERKAIHDQIDTLLEGKTTYRVYAHG
ncbi:MAG: antibiotic biosynthesis monooxygenase [Desulfobacteraceae bacterium]